MAKKLQREMTNKRPDRNANESSDDKKTKQITNKPPNGIANKTSDRMGNKLP